MNTNLLFWTIFIATFIITAYVGKDILKKLKFSKLKFKQYKSPVLVALGAMLVLYGLFTLLGSPERGYITTVAFAFGTFFAILANSLSQAISGAKTNDVQLLSGTSIILTSVLGIGLLLSFLSIWNSQKTSVFLLAGFSLAAVILTIIVKLKDSEKNGADLFVLLSVSLIAAMALIDAWVVLLIAALGALSATIGGALGTSKNAKNVTTNLLAFVSLIFGAWLINSTLLAIAGGIGILMSLSCKPLSQFYSNSKFRPMKSAAKGNLLSTVMESALVPVTLLSFTFLVSFGIGSAFGSGWTGVVIAGLGALCFASTSLQSDQKEDSGSLFALYLAVALVLTFAAYQLQMQTIVGEIGLIVNLGKLEVLVGLFAGGAIALLSASFALHKSVNKFAQLILVLVTALLVAFVLKAEAASALIIGVAIVGIPLSWTLAVGAKLLQESTHRKLSVNDTLTTSMLLASILVLTIAPLLV